MQMKLKSSDPHPAGVYVATITRVVAEDEGKFGPQLKVGMATEAGEICVLASQYYSAKSKLGKIVQAAFGSLPEDLVTEALIGAKLTVVIEHEKRGDDTWDKATAFLPAGKNNVPDLFAAG